MTKKTRVWALAAVLAPVLALGLGLPFGRHAGRPSLPALEPDDALLREVEALIAQDDALVNRLVSSQEIDRAARQGYAAVIRSAAGKCLPVGGFAQPVPVERLVLLFSDELQYAVVNSGGRQSVFALGSDLVQRLRMESNF